MATKLFRSDLYYRLKVFPITVLRLCDRPEDIPILARHFVQKYAKKMNRRIETIRVRLLWNDAPGRVEAVLVLFNVKFPVGVEVS